jgi:hypothetical protein
MVLGGVLVRMTTLRRIAELFDSLGTRVFLK